VSETRSPRWIVIPLLAFALGSLTAGVLSAHDPRSKGYFRLFFSDPVHLKAGFASVAAALALFQIFTAAWIFRKLPWRKPAWVNRAHRWSGRLAFAFTLPVAYHCIFKLGFRSPDGRVLAHSLFGCAVYGGYAAKVTIVRLHRFPRLVLPVAGSLLFTILIGVWYTSALWLYRHTTNAAPAYSVPTATASPGAAVFAKAGCGGCHTFKAAGSSASIGPNLDDLAPSFAQVKKQVENGSGLMPSFRGTLTPQEIRDVATYVSSGG
jgi:cytochrome c553